MKILYLVNQYPKVSHTFIRREILALEEQGHEVERVAMRSDEPSEMSQIDKSEFSKTHYVLQQPKIDLIKQLFITLTSEPKLFFKALKVMGKMYWASKQSFLIHLIYLVESCNVVAVCKAKNVEHIHAHFGTNPAEVAMYTSILSGVPYSFTVHGPEEFDKPLILNLNQKVKYAHKVIAITNYCKSQLFRWSDYKDWDKVKIVHCALESDFFDRDALTNGKNNDVFQFLCIGRLCEQKGQLLLLQAFSKFIELGNKGFLTLAGDGEMRRDVEQFIEKNKLNDHVKITGWVDSNQIKTMLSNSHAMLLPSFAEGLPVAIMEAMATGVPVISTAIAGIPELVKHNETGFLVAPGSVDELQLALSSFVSLDTDTLNRIKHAAFDAVSTYHDADTEAAKLATFIQGQNG
jgi:glycosyltransferase involved in cell wall biosynthesis